MTCYDLALAIIAVPILGSFCVLSIMLVIAKKRAEQEELKRLQEDEKRYFEALIRSLEASKEQEEPEVCVS